MTKKQLVTLLISASLTGAAMNTYALTVPNEEQSQSSQNSGVYLALRQAFLNSDDQRVKEYLQIQLKQDPNNPILLEEAVLSAFYEMDLELALEYAERLDSVKEASIASQVVRLTKLIKDNQFEEAATYVKENKNLSFISPEILEAWQLSLSGDTEAGLELLETTAEEQGELSFVFDYQRAMMEANQNKDYQAAAEILNNSGQPVYLSDLDFYSHLALLRLADSPDFDIVMSEGYGDAKIWPGFINDLVKKTDSGEIDESLDFASPQNAIGAYINALMMSGQELSLEYAVERLMRGISPNLAPNNAWFLREYMSYFFNNGEFDDVIYFSEQVNNDSFLKIPNEQIRVNANFASENKQAVDAWVAQPTRNFADELAFKADVYRRNEDYENAAKYYEQALAITGLDSERMVYSIYGLAMSYERLNNWERAEPLFLKAIELKPDSSDMLNYLGYSYVDRGEKLDQGLQMIEKAVELSPDQFFIIDSLGWAYYRLGRFEDALDPLEEAIALEPSDATVNAHLGDLYWQLGRKREARYQWKRAQRYLEEDNNDLTMNELNDRIENGL